MLEDPEKKRDYLEPSIFFLILFGIYLTSWYNFLLFHTIAELFSIVIAGGIFVIGWNSRKNIDNSFFLVIGISFLFVGFIDLLHTLSYAGMGIFVEYDANLPTQLWIAGRYLQALSFLLGSLVVNKKIKTYYLTTGYTIITFVLLSLIFIGLFPDAYIVGSGLTPFKIISEYIINLILFITILIMYKYRNDYDKKVLILIICSILATMISELAFTFYVGVYGFSNLVGHIFKLIAFYLLYKSIIRIGLETPFNLVYRKLKTSEQKITDAYSELDQIFNAALPIRIIDNDCKIIKVNDTFTELFNFKREVLLGKKCFEILPHEFCHTEICSRNQILSGKEEVIYETKQYQANGTELTLIVDSVPYRAPDGEFLGLIQNYTDITERKKAEEKISNLAKFPSEDPYPVLRVSERGIIYSNKAGEEILGIKEKEQIPLILRDDVEEVLADNTLKTVEKEIDNKMYSFVITPVKGAKYINIYGTDITERRKAEKRLEQLISTVSHELRTPITVILMSLDYLRNQKEKITPELTKQLMESISRNTSLLHELAEDILMISRIDEKKIDLELSEYSPYKMINEILTLLEPIYKEKNIEIEADVDENIRLKGDPKRMDHIFRIIIDNAIKYSNINSKIGIKAIDNYKGKYNPEEKPVVLIKIKDYGIGIPKKDLPLIFDRFFRSDQVKDITGTGLGLSIAKDLVHLHHGEIYVESEFRKGSEFVIFLPKNET